MYMNVTQEDLNAAYWNAKAIDEALTDRLTEIYGYNACNMRYFPQDWKDEKLIKLGQEKIDHDKVCHDMWNTYREENK